jgi:hypothetical protein
VLPASLADDPDRLARFDREARTLASLNHPSIGAIHGLEDTDGTKVLKTLVAWREPFSTRIRRASSGIQPRRRYGR